jgi:hypothetical protein
MNLIEHVRKLTIEDFFNSVDTFKNCWDTWRNEITKRLGTNYTATEIIDLGDNLSDIFNSTNPKNNPSIASSGRGQGDLSAGGTGWEALLCWYLNLCAIGSRLVIVKKHKLLPSSLIEAKGIIHDNVICNSESDLVAIVFPEKPEFVNDISSLNLFTSKGIQIPLQIGKRVKKINYHEINDHLGSLYFQDFEMGIIQCKTNWNDNSQIPMLWGLVYDSIELKHAAFTIGGDKFSIKDLKNFTYSFATVPSNDRNKIKDTSISVKRVENLSGGNYWGYPFKKGVARNIKGIFSVNFKSAFNTNHLSILNSAIVRLPTEYSYFNI